MRISDWSSDVCSSDLAAVVAVPVVAILAAIAIPAYNDYTIRAEATAGLVGAASAMQRAVDEFEGAHDRCPGNDDFAPLLKQFAAVEKATTVRSEEHTSELQSLMRISYAVFCLKKTKQK